MVPTLAASSVSLVAVNLLGISIITDCKENTMNTPNEETIQDLINKLDKMVPKEQAQVRIDQFKANSKEASFMGNKYGYFRFGIEFLKGGLSDSPGKGVDEWRVDVDLKYLLAYQPIIGFDEFIRNDSLSPQGTCKDISPDEKKIVFYFSCLMLGVAVFALIGMVYSVVFLFALFF